MKCKSMLSVAVVLACSVVALAQIDGLEVRHVAGQTFITFDEIDPPSVPANADDFTVRRIVDQAKHDAKLTYRIYRSDGRITKIDSLTPVVEIGQLSCYNVDYYGADGEKAKPAVRYVVVDGGRALEPGRGLYVHNPACDGSAESYYAVTAVVEGVEDLSLIHI